jgi:hypothetical protein
MSATKYFDATADGDTGLKRVTSIGIRNTSAGAAQANLRLTNASGQIVKVFDSAATLANFNMEVDLVCSDGNFFFDVVSGTWVGAIGGEAGSA